MIKRSILTLLTLVVTYLAASAQHNNIEWTTLIEHIEADNYQLTLRADIESDYHIYGTGEYEWVNATQVEFTPSQGVELIGNYTIKGDLKSYFDEMLQDSIESYSGIVEFNQRVKLTSPSAQVKAHAAWMICSPTTCTPPDDGEFTFDITSHNRVGSSQSLWALIIEAIIWGFAALLTPCVFPMIPMTISFFIKGEGGASKGRLSALLYGLFIVALYTLPIAAIIMVTKWLGGDAVMVDIFSWIATHWLPNTLFFVIFMLFAASLLGAFEITLPSWIINKSDQHAGRESLLGILFLALTLVLVSFSCTGPIVGAVLIKSTSGEFWSPIITMLSFSAAFALPFVLFAIFPSALKHLPKSGGWLNSVKVTLGFVEIALGLKFLSVADQTYHWGILPREVYLAVWIVIFTLLGLYLLGKLKLKHDSDMPYIGVGRLALAIVTFSFVVYLIPGMWGAPLTPLSGYLPPLYTQEFTSEQSAKSSSSELPDVKYGDMLHLPHGLDGFFDIDQGRAYASEVGKPHLVVLTGHGCVNCREMEARVWSDPRVLDILGNDYVITALYMDDKRELPASEWITTPSGRTLKSMGRVNAYRALELYGVNAQPYYILESPNGTMIAPPRGYNLDPEAFITFLQQGL